MNRVEDVEPVEADHGEASSRTTRRRMRDRPREPCADARSEGRAGPFISSMTVSSRSSTRSSSSRSRARSSTSSTRRAYPSGGLAVSESTADKITNVVLNLEKRYEPSVDPFKDTDVIDERAPRTLQTTVAIVTGLAFLLDSGVAGRPDGAAADHRADVRSHRTACPASSSSRCSSRASARVASRTRARRASRTSSARSS